MMAGMIGALELVILGMLLLGSLTIPAAVLVFAIRIYRKLDRIERALGNGKR